MTLYKGIDVSRWQGNIDWTTVKETTDIHFAIIRASAGISRDKFFTTNVTNALACGIHCGVYVYSMATTIEEAQKEAEFILKAIKPYEIKYPVYYDIEDSRQMKLSNKERTALVQAFCDKINAANYIAGVYANFHWFNTKFDMNKLKKYEKWVAQWEVATPGYDGAYTMWQYSSTGKITGIRGNVNLNNCYVDYLTYPQNFKAGTKLTLKNTPLYSSSIRKQPAAYLTGTYYIYDGIAMNNRFRITNLKKNVKALPISAKVTGYVQLKDLV